MEDISVSSISDTVLWAGYFLYKLMMMLTVCSLATYAVRLKFQFYPKFLGQF